MPAAVPGPAGPGPAGPVAATPDWRAILSAALDGPDPTARFAALATVDSTGQPRVRTVVLRAHQGDHLWLTADAQSAKIEDLRHEPRAELCLYLPGPRMQLRLTGTLHEERDPATRQVRWQTLNPALRASFGDPPPGTPRAPEAMASADPGAEGPPSPRLAVLRFELSAVDLVDLTAPALRRHQHRRTEAGWVGAEIWP